MGTVSQDTTFEFSDKSLNITVHLLTTYSGKNQTTTYHANDAEISSAEYNSIMGGLSKSDNSSGSTQPPQGQKSVPEPVPKP